MVVRRQPGTETGLIHGGHPATSAWPSWLAKVLYSACSGVVATVAGAGASLAVTAADRVAVWCVVAGATSVGGGLMWYSGLVSAYRKAHFR
jgi:hypothetical protein